MHCGCNINLPDEIDINSPIVIEPDEINSTDATLSSDINGAEDDITTKIVAANECWNEAVSEVLPSVIIIQKYTRMYIAKKNSMRGGAYHRRTNGRHAGCNDCNLQVHDNSDVSDQNHQPLHRQLKIHYPLVVYLPKHRDSPNNPSTYHTSHYQ